MNDLAEKALHGLDIARREIAARPVASLGFAGFVLAAVVVVTGGRIGAAPAAVPLDHWLGLLPPAGYQRHRDRDGCRDARGHRRAARAVAADDARLAARAASRRHQVWTIAAIWAVPFAVGPPLLSTDIYRYVASGELARRAHSPYHHGPTRSAACAWSTSIDPSWRSARSTDGPLATFVDHLAVSVTGGSVIAAVIVLRVVAVLSVIAIGRLAADLGGTRRTAALCLTVLNPAVLLFVVSAGPVTGVIVALLLGRAARREPAALVAGGDPRVHGRRAQAGRADRRRGESSPCTCSATRRRAKLRVALRDGVVALAALTVIVFSVPFGLGWIANLSSAMHAHTPFAPASWSAT